MYEVAQMQTPSAKNPPMSWQLSKTDDGSHTLYNVDLDESYHSKFGAITESTHVYIKNGLHLCCPVDLGKKSRTLNILEIGFGTGLNALLTLLEAEFQNIHVHYTAIEAHPLSEKIFRELNYTQVLQREDLQAAFLSLHTCSASQELDLSPRFKFIKYLTQAQDFYATQHFDVIYFDAFAPNKQPEMWSQNLLQKMHDLLNERGILVTYCAQGQFRRALKAIGFGVESKPGPLGKREITVATRKSV